MKYVGKERKKERKKAKIDIEKERKKERKKSWIK